MSKRTTIDIGITERGTSLRVSVDVFSVVQAIIANRGRGKTWLAKTLCEQAHDIGWPFVAIDPKGDWWGLAADGEGKALDVIVLGGNHGHVPLPPESGTRTAQAVVESAHNFVIDTSLMRKKATHRFMAEFLEELFALKGRKSNQAPLHLFWDETEQSAPQKPGPEQARVLGAAEDCVKLGRGRGLGMTLICQRPATLNKNLLDLSDVLYMMGIPGPRDKKAVLMFLEDNMDADELKIVKQSLAGLPTGEFWAWSAVYDFFERCTSKAIRTYDSGRTPGPGKSHDRVNRREIDIDKLAAELSEYVEKAKADDPKELRKQLAARDRTIKQLEAGQSKQSAVADQSAIDDAVASAVADAIKQRDGEWFDGINNACSYFDTIREAREAVGQAVISVHSRILDLREMCNDLGKWNGHPPKSVKKPLKKSPAKVRQTKPAPAASRQTQAPATHGDFAPNSAQQRILNALAQLEMIGMNEAPVSAVGFIAGIKPTGGHFSNTVGPLSMNGLIERNAGTMSLTEVGSHLADHPDDILSLDEYHASIRNLLKTGAQRSIFDAIVDAGWDSITVEQIGEATGINHSGGHFSNSIGPLSTLGLIERRSGIVTPTRLMYPEALT